MRLQGIPSWTFSLCLDKILIRTFMLRHIVKRYLRLVWLLGNTLLIYQDYTVYFVIWELTQDIFFLIYQSCGNHFLFLYLSNLAFLIYNTLLHCAVHRVRSGPCQVSWNDRSQTESQASLVKTIETIRGYFRMNAPVSNTKGHLLTIKKLEEMGEHSSLAAERKRRVD